MTHTPFIKFGLVPSDNPDTPQKEFHMTQENLAQEQPPKVLNDDPALTQEARRYAVEAKDGVADKKAIVFEYLNDIAGIYTASVHQIEAKLKELEDLLDAKTAEYDAVIAKLTSVASVIRDLENI